MTVPPILIRRLKTHFFALPCGVDIILGVNGYIWVSKHVKEHEQVGEDAFDAAAVYSNKNDVSHPATFLNLCVLNHSEVHRRSNKGGNCQGFQYHQSAGRFLRSHHGLCAGKRV